MKAPLILSLLWAVLSSPTTLDRVPPAKGLSLTVVVHGLKNSEGSVQFALYDREGSLPDQKFKNYHQIKRSTISRGDSRTTFFDLVPGTYAVSVLHDENGDGKIEMGLVLPKEGIGFSNFRSIGLSNRPNFRRASFPLERDSTLVVDMIYK